MPRDKTATGEVRSSGQVERSPRGDVGARALTHTTERVEAAVVERAGNVGEGGGDGTPAAGGTRGRRRQQTAASAAARVQASPAIRVPVPEGDQALALLEAAETAVGKLQCLEDAVIAVRQVDAARIIARRASRSRALHVKCFVMMLKAQRAGGCMLRDTNRARGGRRNPRRTRDHP
jgi:hypothetical protein